MKVGTPVYKSFDIGKFFHYASPGQYPKLLFADLMFSGAPATRYSDARHSIPWKGNHNNLRMHLTMPWTNSIIANNVRRSENTYVLYLVMLYHSNNLYGAVDGIFYITGFNNRVENILTSNSKNYVVIQDVVCTSFSDYYALELS
ncbi:hypothetical protein [Candidatus Williamhamiltonella defendens]|uniref:hypothetical protein n=1 Tax=Candidatus Williamhamiltonella defendens TaxID=138072 RepID=UPI00130D4BFE|nr:hypothetical protein [Candidatus Hamiltonella defensa]